QPPENRFLRMIRARGISCRRSNATVLLSNQIFVSKILRSAIAPFFTDTLVQKLRKCLRQTVPQGLGHDRVVIVVVALELSAKLLHPKTGTHRKRANIIPWHRYLAGLTLRRDEIRQTMIELALTLFHLLPQKMERGQNLHATLIAVKLDIIPDGIGREEA